MVHRRAGWLQQELFWSRRLSAWRLTRYVDINIMMLMSSSASGNVSFADTIRVRDHCLCLHVQRAARALARRFDEALRPVELTNGQFSLLMSLNRPGPTPMASVAALLAIDRTTLTAALKPLKRRDLLSVTADPGDRRARLLTLTPKGKALLSRALPIWETTHVQLEAALPGGDATALRAGLRAML
jgi:DNA-binding MarR family transcriptional regulator